MPYSASQNEEEVLKYWEASTVFERSVNERPDNKPYVFYDGPPFASGLPHYGHFVGSIMKDAVPRYFTMRGFKVERVWGWDCHGLPIENLVEKEMGSKSKKDIEAMGVAEFNERCRSKVLGYVEDWKKTVRRLGRWVDMEHAYVTMSRDYMESVWWVFKQLYDKGLIYEDYRAMHICPRCETTLSQQEVSEGYKDVKDISVYVKFKVKANEVSKKIELPDNTSILAWTTTPWTLPGNVALAVGGKVNYILVKSEDNYFVVAKALAEKVFVNKELSVEKELTGEELVGLTYEPLFDYYAKDETLKNRENGWQVYAADFVTDDSGTGIAHEAPAFGADDWELGKKVGLPFVQHVGMDGRFKSEVLAFAGLEVKPKSEDDKVRLGSDIAVLKYLQENNLFFSKENLVHSYPHCWRCDTPLLNYATSSWFVKVTAVKDEAIKQAEKINWSPEHIKEGRFGQWLGGARDWSISRQRFWASVMPIWKCESCKELRVFGSASELEEASGQKVDDLHKHIVDLVTVTCECSGTMKRVLDVLDTWFDSGSMPYAQMHYPFENKEKFEASFPAEFIAEGQDQTRAWFYYLHVLATSLFQKPAFKNVIVNGIVLAEDGKKMSKKLQNYPDPNLLLEKYGADALRYYLITSPVMHAESLNFSEDGVREAYGKVVNTLWNVVEFYKLFATENPVAPAESKNVLDQWILAKLQNLIVDVTREMEAYNLSEASRPIAEFIDELSTWYVRRSRDRVKGDDGVDKAAALATLREVLIVLSKVMAPFTPFVAEKVWQEISGSTESVHLEMWPEVNEKWVNQDALTVMQFVRSFASMAHMQRAQHGVNVRQVLQSLSLSIKHSDETWSSLKYWNEGKKILADEINVKEIILDPTMSQDEPPVKLDLKITEALQKEGLARECIRTINQLRKEKGLSIQDQITITYQTEDVLLNDVLANFSQEINQAVLSVALTAGSISEPAEVKIDGRPIYLSIQTV
ncbi:MAG: isoleucine--tRNA ligase [Candidatus Magasanikbacteria bacterium]|nr:isoleucine--tRNA ligase [Candidatus Magasanikbacteria bacterium]